MTKSPYSTILLLISLAVGPPLAGSDDQPYSEHKSSQYVVRISRGLGEPHAIGSYAIRVYDANALDLVGGTVRTRDGELVKSWVLDGNGEKQDITIFVWTRVVGSGAYGTLEVLKFDGKRFRRTELPSAKDSLVDGHMGHDTFDVEDGIIYWQFPVYRAGDFNSSPSGGARCLELTLGENQWSLSNHRIGSD